MQKRRPLDRQAFQRLKSRKLIEGRRPALFVAAKVADAAGERAAYIKNRAFDREYYKNLVLAYLGKFGAAARADLDSLLLEKLSATWPLPQKKKFVRNLLQEMKGDGSITLSGVTRWARWRMARPLARAGGSD